MDLPASAAAGSFVPPTIIEITRIADVGTEVFGPVLHVLRFARGGLDRLIDDINAAGFGLTFGLHTRIDETIAHVTSRIEAGNIYVNRNIIGAVVGAQPFGGCKLSGTGPKAGGPLYLRRLVNAPSNLVADGELPGPAGEENQYFTRPRGRIAAIAQTAAGLQAQLAAIAATGNTALLPAEHPLTATILPANVIVTDAWASDENLAGVLFEGPADALLALNEQIAARPGAILAVHTPPYRLEFLREEVAISTNTAAAGGNATLLAIS
jgi:RHH-type proline utilization regulon transcriptional repressor/proline dehydrogenase/delta 1-pyrroline-5-carboxylate dehydrogenase